MEKIEQGGGYPKIKVTGKNKYYAKLIQSNIGGANSEMSAVSLYFYNQIITDDIISKSFLDINIVEMHHLEIFGEIAKLLGSNPLLLKKEKGKKIWWSPTYNNYPRHLKPLLENSLLGELKAIEKYKQQARIIQDPFIVEYLERIIEDEKHHVAIFKSLIKQYC